MLKKKETLKKITKELLVLMGSNAKADVEYNKEQDAWEVNIEGGEETGLLIGKKGETLKSIQTILGIFLKGKLGEWNRVVVNVGDYRQKEEEYLKTLALNAAQRAKETGEPQPLYNLSAAQRRIVHLQLSSDDEVKTESIGEGAERYLVVSPVKD